MSRKIERKIIAVDNGDSFHSPYFSLYAIHLTVNNAVIAQSSYHKKDVMISYDSLVVTQSKDLKTAVIQTNQIQIMNHVSHLDVNASRIFPFKSLGSMVEMDFKKTGIRNPSFPSWTKTACS